MRLRFFCTLLLATVVAACHPSRPVVDTGVRPDVGGSIAGRVTANDGATALGARKVTAVNESTGARFDVSTASNGGYTVRVPPGMYRLEVELRAGETLATVPDSTEVEVGDLDAGRDFVVSLAARR